MNLKAFDLAPLIVSTISLIIIFYFRYLTSVKMEELGPVSELISPFILGFTNRNIILSILLIAIITGALSYRQTKSTLALTGILLCCLTMIWAYMNT